MIDIYKDNNHFYLKIVVNIYKSFYFFFISKIPKNHFDIYIISSLNPLNQENTIALWTVGIIKLHHTNSMKNVSASCDMNIIINNMRLTN